MPSSPSTPPAATVRSWEPMPLADLTAAGADVDGAVADAIGTVPATATFEPDRREGAAVESFAVSPTVGIPDDVLAPARTAAQAAGYADGWTAGMRAARETTAARLADDQAESDRQRDLLHARHQRAIDALATAAARLDERAVTAAHDIEDQIITAAWRIAEALVGRALADDTVRGPAALTRALSLAPIDADVTVHVSPADHALLADATPATAAGHIERSDGRRRVTIVADDRIADGDAVSHCGATSIDARLTAAVDRVRQVLAP